RVKTAPTNLTNSYDNSGILSDSGAFWGVHVKNVSGTTPTLIGFNWDGNEDTVSQAISLDTNYVFAYWHTGGNILLEVYSSTALVGSQQSEVSGNTSSLTNQGRIGQNSNGANTYDGRIGELAIYNAHNATDRANATQYMRDKWLPSRFRSSIVVIS